MKLSDYPKACAVAVLAIVTGSFCFTYAEQAQDRNHKLTYQRLIDERRQADAIERLPGGALYDPDDDMAVYAVPEYPTSEDEASLEAPSPDAPSPESSGISCEVPY